MYDAKFLDHISISLLAKKLKSFPQDANEEAGFSLIEIVAVLLMVGILSALSIGSWLAFLNKQELNKANDVVLNALRQAQQEAKRKKVSYSVSFINDTTNTPRYVVYAKTGSLPPSGLWKTLLDDLNTKTRIIAIASNLSGENTATSAPTTVPNTAFPPTAIPSQTISFDYTGALDWQSSSNTDITATQKQDISYSKGIIVAVQGNGITRCVIIRTLLGTIQTGKDSQCS
jgi:prepilin-type N-terminal cleavage/methylation domain-containing protein